MIRHMTPLSAKVLSIRFREGAWIVDAAGVMHGPYMAFALAVRIAAIHARIILTSGRAVQMMVYDADDRLIARWPRPDDGATRKLASGPEQNALSA